MGGPASCMYFSAGAEGRISYGHLGRTNLFYLFFLFWTCILTMSRPIRCGVEVICYRGVTFVQKVEVPARTLCIKP